VDARIERRCRNAEIAPVDAQVFRDGEVGVKIVRLRHHAGARPYLAARLWNGKIEDAYLAATAEWLAWKFNLPPPRWAFEPSRSLRRPWFASQLAALRAVLLLESPAAFRSRNLFVSENALSRA